MSDDPQDDRFWRAPSGALRWTAPTDATPITVPRNPLLDEALLAAATNTLHQRAVRQAPHLDYDEASRSVTVRCPTPVRINGRAFEAKSLCFDDGPPYSVRIEVEPRDGTGDCVGMRPHLFERPTWHYDGTVRASCSRCRARMETQSVAGGRGVLMAKTLLNDARTSNVRDWQTARAQRLLANARHILEEELFAVRAALAQVDVAEQVIAQRLIEELAP